MSASKRMLKLVLNGVNCPFFLFMQTQSGGQKLSTAKTLTERLATKTPGESLALGQSPVLLTLAGSSLSFLSE